MGGSRWEDDEEDEEEPEEAPSKPFIPKPTKGHSLANLKNLKEDDQLRALAIYLSRNGQISNRHLARMVQCHESSIAQWRSEGHWPELARQKLAEQEAMLVSFSAEFCARRLAAIHTQDLQRIEELNRQLSLQLAKNITVDDDGEETLAGKKTKAYELKAIAEALQFNVRTARLILGADIEKCLGPDIPILLYNGSIKMSQDIVTGDLLMGPDSGPRTVASTVVGFGDMYRVVPNKGDSYTCNDIHVLSLKMTGMAARESGEVINMPLDDYLKKGYKFKHDAKGWRTGVHFPSSDQDLPIPPYILGAWLGDGTTKAPQITTADPEILSEWGAYGKSVGLSLVMKPHGGTGKAETWSLSGPVGGSRHAGRGGNHLFSSLRDMELTRGKRIPQSYKTSSRKERLDLLAGLIDTDGSYQHGCFLITQKSDELAQDIIFLVRSLGLAAYGVRKRKKCFNNGVWGEYTHITISGNISVVPTRVQRKKAGPKGKGKNALLTGITVEPIGLGRYYGWELDGDGLFLLGDFTVTHNTPAEKGADQLMSLVQAAWASSAMKTSGERVDIHIERTYAPEAAVLSDAAAAEAAGPFPFIDVESKEVHRGTEPV